MRLIDADALIDEIKHGLWDWDSVDGIKSSTVLKQTISDINNMSTMDAVEVVRCKDCKYWNSHKGYCEGLENWFDDEWSERGFCYKGERRE